MHFYANCIPINDWLSFFSLDNLIIIYIRMSICYMNPHARRHAYRMEKTATGFLISHTKTMLERRFCLSPSPTFIIFISIHL